MTDFFIRAPVLAELRFGALALQNGKKRGLPDRRPRAHRKRNFRKTGSSIRQPRGALFRRASRAEAFGGRAVPIMDAMIALAHAMTLATRNVGDFEGLGVPLVDPFSQ
ncbi:MAG: type II toxin-antitoxin system VapC family toxin [Methylocystis sp.]